MLLPDIDIEARPTTSTLVERKIKMSKPDQVKKAFREMGDRNEFIAKLEKYYEHRKALGPVLVRHQDSIEMKSRKDEFENLSIEVYNKVHQPLPAHAPTQTANGYRNEHLKLAKKLAKTKLQKQLLKKLLSKI